MSSESFDATLSLRTVILESIGGRALPSLQKNNLQITLAILTSLDSP